MNVLMLSLMYPDDLTDNASRLSRDGLQNQVNAYQRAMVAGIKANLRPGEAFAVVNAMPVGAFPLRYKSPYIASGEHNGLYELGCVNLPLIKQRGRERRALKVLKTWARQSPDNRTLLIYSLYLPYLRAVARLKKRYPDMRASVMVPDLPNELGLASYRHGLLKRIEYAMGRKRMALCRAMDGFILLTPPMAQALPIKDKSLMVMEGLILDDAAAETLSEPDTPMALYTGTLNRELGIGELIEAFEGMPECELWLCGFGDMNETVKKSAIEHKNIRYLGFVPQEEALRLQAQATLLINPRSPDGVYTRYSFPSKTLEYMRSGKPVVCYRLEGIPEEYDRYLCYIEGEGPLAIRHTVRALLSLTPQERREKGESARRYVLEHKNPRVQGARIVDHLRSLMVR